MGLSRASPALSLSRDHSEAAMMTSNTNGFLTSHSPAVIQPRGNLARCSLPEQWKWSPKAPRETLLPTPSTFPTDKSSQVGDLLFTLREGPRASPEDKPFTVPLVAAAAVLLFPDLPFC